jgi:hypothetical protein
MYKIVDWLLYLSFWDFFISNAHFIKVNTKNIQTHFKLHSKPSLATFYDTNKQLFNIAFDSVRTYLHSKQETKEGKIELERWLIEIVTFIQFIVVKTSCTYNTMVFIYLQYK